MRSGLLIKLAVGAVAFVAGGASAQATLGTEADPELADPAGDVFYSPFHVGERSHEYLDVVAYWFSYNPDDDAVRLSMKVTDATGLRDPPVNWGVNCFFEANFGIQNETAETLRYEWTSVTHTDRITTNVYVSRGESLTPVDHAAAFDFHRPGYYKFTIDRNDLLQHGEVLTQFWGNCSESFHATSSSPPTLIINGDDANGRDSPREFDLASLAPAARGPGREDVRPGPPLDSEGSGTQRAPGLGAPALMIALAAILATLAIRRRS